MYSNSKAARNTNSHFADPMMEDEEADYTNAPFKSSFLKNEP